MAIVVAIDGPSGAGKSSTSRAIAQRAGWNYLDTGALYRGVAWLALEKNVESAQDILKELGRAPLRFVANPISPSIFVGDTDVTEHIRSDEVTNSVSRISAMPEIRAELLTVQRTMISDAERGIVVEGRDIGSVVLPNADFKIYITASDEARAKRRAAQTNADEKLVLEAQKIRDSLDTNRSVSPLVIPKNAVVLDNSDLDFDQSVDRFIQIVSA